MRFQLSSDSVVRSLSFSMMISISRSLIHATCPWRSLFSSNERNLQQIDLSGPGSDTKSLDFFLRSDLTSRLRDSLLNGVTQFCSYDNINRMTHVDVKKDNILLGSED